MALAFFVHPDRRGASVAAAFAARDEYVSISTFYLRRAAGEEEVWQKRPLTPDEDFYPAPYCFMPKKDRHTGRWKGGFLVFTMQVPWLHGSRVDEREETRAHTLARDWQDKKGQYETPHIGTVESFQSALGLNEGDIYTFTPAGRYPTTEDISEALEDRAVEVSCEACNWEVPEDWRRIRRKYNDGTKVHVIWDLRKAKRKGSDGEPNGSMPTKPKGDGDQEGEEEKKESLEEYQC